MSSANGGTRGRSTRALRVAKRPGLLVLGIVVLLFVSRAVGASPSGATFEAAPIDAGWRTYESERMGLSFRYPATWQVYASTMQGRHSGLDPILLASFEIEFTDVGHGLGIPPGEAAVLVGFEGNDRAADQSLVDYTLGCCGVPFHHLARRSATLGQTRAVEMVGEAGQLYIIGGGPNVYSAFTFVENDPRLADLVKDVLSTLHLFRDSPLPIDNGPGVAGRSVGRFIALSTGPLDVTPTWAGPSMKLPWDRSDSHRYTGGPHNWTMNWTCYLAPVDDACGLDFGLDYREVIAAAGGTVQWGYSPGAVGNYVVVDHGGGWSTRYLHLSQVDQSLSWGQTIAQGRVLGISGTAGSGPHLHFEIRYNDEPTTWHGTSVDGYDARMFVRTTDQTKGWNYQGTLIRGSESMIVADYCGAQTYKWSGSDATITAGDGQPVTSTNQRHTGEPSPTQTPIPTPTSAPAPDVSMHKAVTGQSVQAGAPITFVLEVANSGDKAASGVVVTDIVPPEVEAPSFTSTLAVTPTGILSYVWTVEGLEVAERGTITITGRIRSDVGPDATIVNRGTVWDAEDSTPANNTDVAVAGGRGVYLPVCLRRHSSGCVEEIENGGFEWDGVWELPSNFAGCTLAQAHNGDWSMRVGIDDPDDNAFGYSSARQTVTIPHDTTSAILRFWLYSLSGETRTDGALPRRPHDIRVANPTEDTQYALVLDQQDQQIGELLWQLSDGQRWEVYERDLLMYAGQTIKLHFGVYNDGSGGVTAMYVDDVSLELCSSFSLSR